jgi:Amt family ammonium transporter
MVAGLIVPLSVEWLDLLFVDDPGGAISVHGLGGLWGLLAAGLFIHNKPGQWAAQLAGVAALLGVIFPLTYGLNWLLNRVYRLRVSVEGERHGLDMHELGAGAYPESAQSNDFLHH